MLHNSAFERAADCLAADCLAADSPAAVRPGRGYRKEPMGRRARTLFDEDEAEEVVLGLRRVDLLGVTPPPPPNFVLQDISLTVRHRGRLVPMFNRLSGVFPRGRNVLVLGDVEHGTAHLIRLLTGVEHPRIGRIERNVKMSWPMSFTKHLMADFSIRDNVAFMARLYGHDLRYVANFVRDIMQITRQFDKKLQELTNEQRKSFALTLSLAIEFECYILGAPVTSRDAGFAERWNAALAERLRRADLIHVISQKRAVLPCMEVGTILADGQLVFYESVEAALDAYKETTAKRRQSDDDDDDDDSLDDDRDFI